MQPRRKSRGFRDSIHVGFANLVQLALNTDLINTEVAPRGIVIQVTAIMRPEPRPAAGGAYEVRMVLRNPGVVNRRQFVRRRDRLDRVALAIVAAQPIAWPQVLRRRPALADDPERVLVGRLDLLARDPQLPDEGLGAEDLLNPLPRPGRMRIEFIL